MNKAPIVTPELITYLENMFKDKAPELDTPEREIWFDAGAVSVVRHLKHVKAQQEKHLLK